MIRWDVDPNPAEAPSSDFPRSARSHDRLLHYRTGLRMVGQLHVEGIDGLQREWLGLKTLIPVARPIARVADDLFALFGISIFLKKTRFLKCL
jgi:hypothetical protein